VTDQGVDQDQPRPAGLSRRTLLASAGVLGLVGASGAVLAGCSGGAGGGAGGPAGNGPVTVPKSDVPVGGGVIEEASSIVVVQPTAGTFKAYSSICPHQGCPVTSVADGIISCPCHGSTFRVSDGSVVTGPAAQGLTPMTVTVQANDVVVS
jgi:Rieske Fe-S protein